MPMFSILVMSLVCKGSLGRNQRTAPWKVLVINTDGGPLAQQAIADLKRTEGLAIIEDRRRGFPDP